MVDLKEIIEEFERLMADPDTSCQKMLHFLKGINRKLGKNIIPPMLEFVTILKEEKAELFYDMREQVPLGTHLYDILRIDFSYELAKERLQRRKTLANKQ